MKTEGKAFFCMYSIQFIVDFCKGFQESKAEPTELGPQKKKKKKNILIPFCGCDKTLWPKAM